jgi:hypothetical protein
MSFATSSVSVPSGSSSFAFQHIEVNITVKDWLLAADK